MLIRKTLMASCAFAFGLLASVGFSSQKVEAAGFEKKRVVKKGETLHSLANQYGASAGLWKKANGLKSDQLQVGQTLGIVFPYKVTSGDKIRYLADKYDTTVDAIKTLNGMTDNDLHAGDNINIPSSISSISSSEKVNEQPKKKEANKQQSKAKKKKIVKKSSGTKQIAGLKVKQKMDMIATAYGIAGNEQWGNKTAMGTICREGVIAVDPRIIPLGTKVYVTGYNSPHLPKGGFVAVAEDTGGAIKGNRIDIFIDAPESEISNFGIQNVKIYILEK
jgi:3D (Asp-Asp-Asp) domain-containing protein/LysM repeat protein